MHRLGPRRVSLVAMAAALPLACASAAEPSPPRDLLDFEIEPPRIASRIRVMGHVTDPAGEAVVGADVFVQAYIRRTCLGGRAAEGHVRTRHDGWFIRTLYFYSLPSTRTCVVVHVTPPAGSGLAVDSLGNLTSEFRHGRDVDTVLVRVRLARGRAGQPPPRSIR